MVSSCSRCISHSTIYSISSANSRWELLVIHVLDLHLWLSTLCCLSLLVVNTHFFTKLTLVHTYSNKTHSLLADIQVHLLFFFFFSLYLAKEQYFIPGRFGSAVRLTNCKYSPLSPQKPKFVIAFRKLMHVY